MYETKMILPDGKVVIYDYDTFRRDIDNGEFLALIARSTHLARTKPECQGLQGQIGSGETSKKSAIGLMKEKFHLGK